MLPSLSVPVPGHNKVCLHNKEVLPHIKVELPVYQFLPIASCPIAWHHEEEPGSIIMTPSLQILRDVVCPCPYLSSIGKPRTKECSKCCIPSGEQRARVPVMCMDGGYRHSDGAQDAVCFLCCRGALVTHAHITVHKDH